MNTAEEIYKLYPRKIGKQKAVEEIKRALLRINRELMDEGIVPCSEIAWLRERVTKFAQSPAGQRGIFTPYPSTWFHQSRYLDDEREWHEITPQEEENLRRYRAANVGVYRPQ